MMNQDEWFKQYGHANQYAKKPEIKFKEAIRAEVDAKYLTSNEHWDYMLTYISGTLEKINADIQILEASILDLNQANYEQMMVDKNLVARLYGLRETLEWIMELPKALMENGKIARELYDEDKAKA